MCKLVLRLALMTYGSKSLGAVANPAWLCGFHIPEIWAEGGLGHSARGAWSTFFCTPDKPGLKKPKPVQTKAVQIKFLGLDLQNSFSWADTNDLHVRCV